MYVTKLGSNRSTIKRQEIKTNQIKKMKKTSNVKFALDYFEMISCNWIAYSWLYLQGWSPRSLIRCRSSKLIFSLTPSRSEQPEMRIRGKLTFVESRKDLGSAKKCFVLFTVNKPRGTILKICAQKDKDTMYIIEPLYGSIENQWV